MAAWKVKATAIQLLPTLKWPMPKSQPIIAARRAPEAWFSRWIRSAKQSSVTGHRPKGSNPAADSAPAMRAHHRGYFESKVEIFCTAPSLPTAGTKSNIVQAVA